MTIKVGIFGITGRIGTRIASTILASKDLDLSGGAVRPGHNLLNKNIGEKLGQKTTATYLDNLESVAQSADVLIDFSKNQLTENIKAATATGTPIVIGTTGLNDQELKLLEDAAQQIPVLYSPNMSIGANLLISMTEKLSHVLDDSFDIDVFEIHHRGKIDSPSGGNIDGFCKKPEKIP